MQGVIAVAENAPMENLGDLRGKSVAAADRLAVITLLGEATLADQGGLSPDHDLRMTYLPSHNSALMSLAEGRADAAIVGSLVYEKMTSTLGTRLRVLAYTARIPHMIYMARPGLAPQVDAIRNHLLAFNALSGSNQQNAGLGTSFGTLTTVSEDDLQTLAPLVSRLMARESE
jgi:ABC-type phosphate/phosphonate transport system substrate-binding protein